MAVSGGYPGSYQKNLPITGIALAAALPEIHVFQAGTGFQENTIVTKGGRVLTVTSSAATLNSAVIHAQKALSMIQFEGMYFRKDIGYEFL